MDPDSFALVGRSRERRVVEDALGRLGRGAVCLELVGEPGIGKTTMLTWLRALAVDGHAVVLGGRGSEFEHDLPFAIFIDALDGHLAEVADRGLRDLSSDEARELAEIFPALQSGESGPPSRRSSSERFRAYRAVRTLLERLAATRPLVLMLDDLHWADQSSAELIGALLRRPPDARVFIALAYRTRQVPERLAKELSAAVVDGVLTRVELGPLSKTDVDALLRDVGSRERAWLFRESGGNPFYLHQLARSADRAAVNDDLGPGVPLAVVASLFAELDGVSENARRLAQAAAVAGDPFDLDIAADIGGLERQDALTCLDELVGADLVRTSTRPLRFVFRHPLVHRAVYESARPGWRIHAHALADTVMARRGDSPTARAHHVEQSAPVGDDQAIEVLLSAAAAAIVPVVAAHWLDAALRLTPTDSAQRPQLLWRLAGALVTAGRLEESRAAAIDALASWPADGDREQRTALVVMCATIERLLGRHEQSRARLSSAASELDDSGSPAGVALAIELACARVFAEDFETVPEAALVALRGATTLGDPLLIAAATTIACFGDYCVGELDSARARAAEATALVARLNDAAVAMRPELLFFLGWSHRFLDRFEAAVDHFDRGIAVSRESGHSQFYVELAVGRAHALTGSGRLAESQTAFEEVIEAARLSDNQQTLAWALGFSALPHIETGSLDAAVRAGREAVSLAVDPSIVSSSCGIVLGIALIERGDWAEGVELIIEWGGGPQLGLTFPLLRPWIYECLTCAEIGRGHIEEAADWARLAGTVLVGVACELPRAHADRAMARVLLARGDIATAAELALGAAARADGIESPVEASRSRLLAGRALAAGGLRHDAAEQLRKAEERFARCGAARLRAECVRELRRIGRRVSRAGVRGDTSAGGVNALSGREREVANLVRERHTNREIAARLYLSEKTVEAHLRSIFVKLSVSSRADAARALDACER